MIDFEHTADKFVFKVRKGLLYTRENIWLKHEADRIRVGVTDYAQRRGGDIIFAEVEPVKTKVTKGGLLGKYETIKLVQDILSPVDGEVTEINPLLESKPEKINIEPYDQGWIAIIKPSAQPQGLLSAEQYLDLMKTRVSDELKKIKGS